jgi:hypothetical protein
MKSSQCGISEWLIAYSFYFADQYPENVFYGMPAKDQIKDYVQGRVDPRIDDSAYLRQRIISTDNIDLKQVGTNFIYYRGSQNRRQIITVDAGCLLLDELNDMIQRHISIMEKRLGASAFKIKRRVGVPSTFEYGIHREFLMTDQKEYHLTCGECGKKQVPTWDKNISPAPTREKEAPDPDEVKLVCSDCGAELDRRQDGEWIPQNPGAGRSGYHVSKLILPGADLLELWLEYRDIEAFNLPDFYNDNLGLPYAADGGKLNDMDLNACREEYQKDFADNPPKGCSMGVDVGSVLHVRVSQKIDGRRRAVFIGTVKTFEELDQLMRRFDVSRCVIDGLPETREAARFAQRFAGRVLLAYYSIDDPNKTFEVKDKEVPAKILLNRVRAMDEAANQFIERQIAIPQGAAGIPGYYDQLKSPQKVKTTDKNGNERYIYVENGRADHFFHAEVYDFVASQTVKRFQIFAV